MLNIYPDDKMMISAENQSTILIVDEDESARSLLKTSLEEGDYEVLLAADGEEGLEICRTQLSDLVLIGISIPGIDGVELCKILHEDENLSGIPVIMFTAPEATELKIRAFQAGAVDCLTKPVNNGELLARIGTHLKINRLSRSLQQTNKELLVTQQQLLKGLHAAAELQQKLLPKDIPGCRTICFSSYFQPCQEVGGDIYNIQRLDSEHLAFYVLDVSGHGFPAAMMTALATQALSGCQSGGMTSRKSGDGAQTIISPGEVVQALDKAFPINRFNLYMTIVYLLYNTKNHMFRYCCAGHPPPVLVTKEEEIIFLDAGGPPAGMDGTWNEGKGRLNSGDRIYFYTDGLSEYSNGEGEFYGKERLVDSMAGVSKSPLQAAVKTIIGKLKSFGNQAGADDDMALLAVERNEEEGTAQQCSKEHC